MHDQAHHWMLGKEPPRVGGMHREGKERSFFVIRKAAGKQVRDGQGNPN
jgi:hypothetical protein